MPVTRKTSTDKSLLGDIPGFQRALLSWYRTHRRRLPWRESPSLYGTVVSEFMLQQTQVKTVLPYFARWMETLPDFQSLAKADEARVLKLWEGLGYYSRARNLHRVAKAVAAMPTPPRTAQEWRSLPGIGPYTAAAITSIALGEPEACVDGNVVRILSRLSADGSAFRDSASAAKAFTPIAEKVLTRDSPGDHNQAMMELGATLCSRTTPACPGLVRSRAQGRSRVLPEAGTQAGREKVGDAGMVPRARPPPSSPGARDLPAPRPHP